MSLDPKVCRNSKWNSVSTQRPWHRISLQLRLVIMNMQILMISNALAPASCSRAGCSVAVEALLLQVSENYLLQPRSPPLTSLEQYLLHFLAWGQVGNHWPWNVLGQAMAPGCLSVKRLRPWKAKVSLLCAGWKEGRLPSKWSIDENLSLCSLSVGDLPPRKLLLPDHSLSHPWTVLGFIETFRKVSVC